MTGGNYRGIDTIAGGNGVDGGLPAACGLSCCLSCLPATGGGCEAHIVSAICLCPFGWGWLRSSHCLCHLSLPFGWAQLDYTTTNLMMIQS